MIWMELTTLLVWECRCWEYLTGVHAGDGDDPGRRLAEGAGERGVLLGPSLIKGI
jgi:hypothetical protein